MVYNETLNIIPLDAVPLNDSEKVCKCCTIYIVLFAIFFMTSICISCVSIYFDWYLKKVNVRVKFNPSIQTTIY